MKKLCKVKILGKELQLYLHEKEKYFAASDIGEMIEYSKANISKMVNKIDEDEKILEFVARTNSMSKDKRKKEQWFLTKDGLYEMLFQSRKPIAKKFKKEVKRILKNIEENGFYISTDKDEKWIGTRSEGKNIRLDETDEIKEFVEYAKNQGSSKPNWYYKHFTKLVNKKLNIPKDLKRDNMSQGLLYDIQALERVITMKLPKLVNEDMNYKDIYQKIKELINEI